MSARLTPVDGAWVCLERAPDRLGTVLSSQSIAGRTTLRLKFRDGEITARVEEVRSGLIAGYWVQDVPLSAGREALGAGRVMAVRRLADRDQALVQFERDGRSLWLPFEGLRRIMEPQLRFERAQPASHDAAERLALRFMAEALRTWNDATGALDRLDVDPLPHQIQLVHRIMQSQNYNWVIADDVGLGKTIELGLLLAAMESRLNIRRVLIITPAGLTRQWQDEMLSKFQRRFFIYGRDFVVNETWQWTQYERVIASLDLMKPSSGDDGGEEEETHFGRLLNAQDWDVVVFDEAHRLSRTDDGGQTLRYKLASALRNRTERMVLLTGTPHQGDTGKFRSLLQLVQPSMIEQLKLLEFQPELVSQMVLRNRKIDVTYADGSFIFKGQEVRTAKVDAGPEVRAVDRALKPYLQQGYAAAEALAGNKGRAIGFVMTTYRKLASSSIAALYTALDRRRQRLTGLAQAATAPADLDEEGEGDDLLAERDFTPSAAPFFKGEIERVDILLQACRDARPHDGKLATLKSMVHLVVEERRSKVIIFTEYRATQVYLAEAVEQLLGRPAALINGSQSLDEKLAAVRSFEDDAPVLISTEAGGEGLNLHRNCHTLINYDLPWNPSRLVQRIGRIYRYGQRHRVVIINLQSADSIDNEVLSYTLERINRIAAQMRAVSSDYDDRYEAEIVGELLDQIDLREVLDHAFGASVERSKERVEEALARAERARALQAEVLDQLERFDPHALKRLGGFTTGHLAAFVRRAAPFNGAAVEDVSTDGETFTLRLEDDWRGRFEEFGRRTVVRCTTRRRRAEVRDGSEQLDFKNSFVRHLIDRTRSPDFGAGYAAVSNIDFGGELLGAFMARWQDERGEPSGEALMAAVRGADGRLMVDNAPLQAFFDKPARSGGSQSWIADQRRERLEAVRDRIGAAMAADASRYKHPNDLILFGVAEQAS